MSGRVPTDVGSWTVFASIKLPSDLNDPTADKTCLQSRHNPAPRSLPLLETRAGVARRHPCKHARRELKSIGWCRGEISDPGRPGPLCLPARYRYSPTFVAARHARPCSLLGPVCDRVSDEWHRLSSEAVAHLACDRVPGLPEEGVVLGPSLLQPRLEPVRPVAHPVGRDCLHDLLPFEADRPWFEALLGRGLGRGGADSFVRQGVRPRILLGQVRRLPRSTSI
jgi:hypothetical protein